ncbi:MAG: ORF6N domain-containing protein [Paludibacteraceae bacterium]|nr:ORF6N domain-containing protein [Paludibacteraceae bacterium]
MDKNLKFYEIRGHRVLLDRDLAAVFGVETKRMNEQVKRNREKFPLDSVFQLSKEEWKSIVNSCSRSQIATLNTGRGNNLKYLPFAFTEAGVQVLKTLIKSSVDIDFSDEPSLPTIYEKSWNEGAVVLYQPDETLNLEVRVDSETVWLTQDQIAFLFDSSKSNISEHLSNIYDCNELSERATVRKFRTVQIEGGRSISRDINYYNLDAIISVGFRVNTTRGIKFRQWANAVIKQQILLHCNADFEIRALHSEMNHRLSEHEVRLRNVEKQLDCFSNKSLPSVERIFMSGELYDAYALITDIIASARERLVLIDNYMDSSVLKMLTKRNAGVSVTLHTSGRCYNNDEFKLAVEKFKAQYGAVDVEQMSMVHDRYLIADSDVYSLGASFKDAGKKLFGMFKIEFTPDEVLAKIRLS